MGVDSSPPTPAAGEQVPDQRSLDLLGYPGGFDRVGNWVNRQFQLDAFGEALVALGRCRSITTSWTAMDSKPENSRRPRSPSDGRSPMQGYGRSRIRPWTHSRLTAAAGLRSYCAALPLGLQRPEWLALADKIVADTARARNPSSRILATFSRMIRVSTPRCSFQPYGVRSQLTTLAAWPPSRPTRHSLTIDGYAYRFRHDERPLGQAEGSFTLCGFLMALATHQQGDRVDRRKLVGTNQGIMWTRQSCTRRNTTRTRGRCEGTCHRPLFTPSCLRWQQPWAGIRRVRKGNRATKGSGHRIPITYSTRHPPRPLPQA